jgi:hypothetical protein
MDCKKAKHYISHYMNIILEENKKKELHEHLLMCSSCKQYAEALQRQRVIIKKAVRSVSFPESLPEIISTALPISNKLKLRKKIKRLAFLFYNQYKPIALSAAVVSLAIVSVLIFFIIDSRSEGELVSLSGEVICLSCELKKNYNAPCDCSHSGHKYAIRTKDGEYLIFSCSKSTINLDKEEMKGCHIEAVGYLYPKEHYIHIIAINSIKKAEVSASDKL